MENWRQEFYASDYGSEYLAHHGIKGQKWGRRRFQNPDGTLTAEGRARYAKELTKDLNRYNVEYFKDYKKAQSIQQNMGHNPLAKEAFSKMSDAVDAKKNAYKYVKEFNDLSEEDQDKFVTKAAKEAYKRDCKEYPEQMKGYTEEQYVHLVKYDDFGQNMNPSPADLYMQSKGVDYKKNRKERAEADSNYYKAFDKAINDVVESLGDIRLGRKLDSGHVSDALNEALYSLQSEEIFNNGYADYYD